MKLNENNHPECDGAASLFSSRTSPGDVPEGARRLRAAINRQDSGSLTLDPASCVCAARTNPTAVRKEQTVHRAEVHTHARRPGKTPEWVVYSTTDVWFIFR